VADPPIALRDDVSATLSAAIADPAVAADLAAGTLTRAEHWAGFGAFPADPAPAPEPGTAPAPGPTARRQPRTPATPQPSSASLREAEQRNRRNQLIQEAQRRLDNATLITTSAQAEEDRLESEVRDLEERVTTARAELSQARLRARRAEAAERKATADLDRLRKSAE
jgi:hypothetical protein